MSWHTGPRQGSLEKEEKQSDKFYYVRQERNFTMSCVISMKYVLTLAMGVKPMTLRLSQLFNKFILVHKLFRYYKWCLEFGQL